MDSGDRGKFGRQVFGEDGKLKPKAAPELLREDLRRLPGDIVTKDIDDTDRVHELDAPHIRDVLAEEAREKSGEAVWAGEMEEPPPPDAEAPQTPAEAMRNNPQLAVDVVRLRILRAWAEAEAGQIANGLPADMGFCYVWFPHAGNFDDYEAREPPVPIDRDRPKHLRGLDLVLDLTDKHLLDKIINNLATHCLPVDKRYLAGAGKILRPDFWQVQAALRGQL